MIISLFNTNLTYLNNLILSNNLMNFSFLIYSLKLNNKFFILIKNTYKYSWSNQFYNDDNNFNLNYIILKNTNSNFNYPKLNQKNQNIIYNIIYLKKKTSIIKKNINLGEYLVNKINNDKNNYNNVIFGDDFINKDNFTNFNKNLDIKNKIKLLFKNNRLFVKYFFNLKYYRAFSLSRNLKKISNFKKNDFVSNLENNLINILIKVDFFFSKSDCIWFLKHGLISVNSNIIKKEYFLIKTYDIINISNTKYYFYYYKNKFSNLLLNIHKINNKFWSTIKNKTNSFDLKSFNSDYPKWIENYNNFKKDIPIYLEVDYLSMSVIILNHTFNLKNYNFSNFKYINLYLNRLYNWKYII